MQRLYEDNIDSRIAHLEHFLKSSGLKLKGNKEEKALGKEDVQNEILVLKQVKLDLHLHMEDPHLGDNLLKQMPICFPME